MPPKDLEDDSESLFYIGVKGDGIYSFNYNNQETDLMELNEKNPRAIIQELRYIIVAGEENIYVIDKKEK